jgi:hypothetical protein
MTSADKPRRAEQNGRAGQPNFESLKAVLVLRQQWNSLAQQSV